MHDRKKHVRVDGTISVSALAHQMSAKASVILRALWKLGVRRATVNTALDLDTAGVVAAEFGYTVEDVSFREAEVLEMGRHPGGPRRPPVVAVMGHVDHGKTTLLDRIRRTRVARDEAGGITQHLGADAVPTEYGPIVFLDTPGHEAFRAMRRRGARTTDIVLLVVAADDGVMPTTVEAIDAARESDAPVVVAITKADRSDANPSRVKQVLMQHGLLGEEFGGETSLCVLSSATGDGVDRLLGALAHHAERLDLRARTDVPATGVVLESRKEKRRGVVATVLVGSGTLRRGDRVVVGEVSGHVRALVACPGGAVTEALPGSPVELVGLGDIPRPGERFDVVESDRLSKRLIAHRHDRRRRTQGAVVPVRGLERFARQDVPAVRVLLCADTQGSAEVLVRVIEGLSTTKVRAEVVSTNIGAISESDVKLAAATDALIVGFNVEPLGRASERARHGGVVLLRFDVLSDVERAIEASMVDHLEPEQLEHPLGKAVVRARFSVPRVGVVAGCRVLAGKVKRHCDVRVRRDGAVVFTGRVGSLRKLDQDVAEVGVGSECGIVVEGFADVRLGDLVEAFERETRRPSLGS